MPAFAQKLDRFFFAVAGSVGYAGKEPMSEGWCLGGTWDHSRGQALREGEPAMDVSLFQPSFVPSSLLRDCLLTTAMQVAGKCLPNGRLEANKSSLPPPHPLLLSQFFTTPCPPAAFSAPFYLTSRVMSCRVLLRHI